MRDMPIKKGYIVSIIWEQKSLANKSMVEVLNCDSFI